MSRRHDVALGALFASAGKIGTRAGFTPPAAEWAPLKQALSPDGAHDDVALTAWFLARHFPGRDLHFAAKGQRAQSALEAVVAVAERHAAPPHAQRDEARLGEGEAFRRRLEPVLARVRIGGAQAPRETSHLPLRPLSFRVADVDPAAGDGPTSQNLARDEYLHDAWSALLAGVARLPAAADAADGAVAAALSLVERVGTRIPAYPADQTIDLSLFDHARTASAIATALYAEAVEGRDENDRALAKELEDSSVTRFALFGGEVIGGESLFASLGKEAGPGALTGRATWLALLTDAVAHRVLDGLELPASSLLERAGTRFLLLIPARLEGAAAALAADAELGLVDVAGGRLSLARAAVQISLSDLHGSKLTAALESLERTLRASRQQPFLDLLGRAHGYEALFATLPPDAPAIEAQAAGAASGDRTASDRAAGETFGEWARYEALGRSAARARAFARVPYEAQARADKVLRDGGAKTVGSVGMEALGLGYVVIAELPSRPVELGKGSAVLSVAPEANHGVRAEADTSPLLSSMALGLAPPPRRGVDAPCASLASVARGARRYGLLLLDLDDAGAIVRGGFSETQRTLARSLAVSRAVHSFFAGFAATLAVRDDAVHVVRTGSGRLWAVAPWDRLPGLALALRDALHRYAGGNVTIGVSAAVATGDLGTPVGEVVAAAHAGLELAKGHLRADGRGKDAVWLFGSVLSWGEAAIAAEVAHALAELPRDLRGAMVARIGGLVAGALPPRGGERGTAAAAAAMSGGALRRNRRGFREILRLERLASRAGLAHSLIDKVLGALQNGHWDGRTTEHPIEGVLGVAATWCRLLTTVEERHERRAAIG